MDLPALADIDHVYRDQDGLETLVVVERQDERIASRSDVLGAFDIRQEAAEQAQNGPQRPSSGPIATKAWERAGANLAAGKTRGPPAPSTWIGRGLIPLAHWVLRHHASKPNQALPQPSEAPGGCPRRSIDHSRTGRKPVLRSVWLFAVPFIFDCRNRNKPFMVRIALEAAELRPAHADFRQQRLAGSFPAGGCGSRGQVRSLESAGALASLAAAAIARFLLSEQDAAG